MAPTEDLPLGFCRYCVRVRYLAEPDKCTQCAREGVLTTEAFGGPDQAPLSVEQKRKPKRLPRR